MLQLERLVREGLEAIAQFLPAEDVQSLLSVDPNLSVLGESATFWDRLNVAQFGTRNIHEGQNGNSRKERRSAPDAREAYLLSGHCASLAGGVLWLRPSIVGPTAPTSREGHGACRLGDYIVLTGGYTDDVCVYVKHVHSTNDGWQRLVPVGCELPYWAYGATLTAISNTTALRFGGFEAGGYSGETHHMVLLHLFRNSTSGALEVKWETKVYQASAESFDMAARHWEVVAARAYHSATLLFDRWLFIVGGMQSTSSILTPLLLDTKTWTWHTQGITIASTRAINSNTTARLSSPSPRHGCSVVSDLERYRLLLFGGGDGCDLLRSGKDNTEVWELNMNKCTSKSDLLTTLPWTWKLLHSDQNNLIPPPRSLSSTTSKCTLSPAERLNLGRCHASHKVGKDNVLFCFGSGHITTNSVLGYRMDDDSFYHVNARGPTPRARFTFASVYLDDLGILFVHGGFTSQMGSETISNTCLLDLAPGLGRNIKIWPQRPSARAYPSITEADILDPYPPGDAGILSQVLFRLVGLPESERAAAAAHMLAFILGEQQGPREIELIGRSAMIIWLIADGRVTLTEDGEVFPVGRDDDDGILDEAEQMEGRTL